MTRYLHGLDNFLMAIFVFPLYWIWVTVTSPWKGLEVA